jgi:hypothetical protein
MSTLLLSYVYIVYVYYVNNNIIIISAQCFLNISKQTTKIAIKISGMSPRENYTDRTTASCRRS